MSHITYTTTTGELLYVSLFVCKTATDYKKEANSRSGIGYKAVKTLCLCNVYVLLSVSDPYVYIDRIFCHL